MPTSDQLFKRNSALEKVSYVITGEGGLSLPVNAVLYGSIDDADRNVISRAEDLAKVFIGITLYRIVGKSREIIYQSKAAKRIQLSSNDFFHPVASRN